MPRYKYSCAKCELTDVKQLIYTENNRMATAICKICGEILKREFLKPPQEWMNQQRRV